MRSYRWVCWDVRGAQKIDGVYNGMKTRSDQLRLTGMMSFTKTWQGVVQVSHDLHVSGGFKQNFGIELRIAKLFARQNVPSLRRQGKAVSGGGFMQIVWPFERRLRSNDGPPRSDELGVVVSVSPEWKAWNAHPRKYCQDAMPRQS